MPHRVDAGHRLLPQIAPFGEADRLRVAADFLRLDDVGAEDDPFGEVKAVFYQVLSRREDKFTFMSSNLAAPEWSAKDPRITDRLLRNSVTLDMRDVPSYAEWLRVNQRAA